MRNDLFDEMVNEHLATAARSEPPRRTSRTSPKVHAPISVAVADTKPAPQPLDIENGNALRPKTFEDMIGQERVKKLLGRMIHATQRKGTVLDHMLVVGPSGTGKTTIALAVANEVGKRVYQVEAPISHDTLIALREVMGTGDILFIDEIHQQAAQDRRGRGSSTDPEILYQVLEDRQLPTPDGVLSFPEITVIGATTDIGRLPEAFRNRFPIQPRLERYSDAEMNTIAGYNALALNHQITEEAVEIFGAASRSTPRVVNGYVRNAVALCEGAVIEAELAREVVRELNQTTPDGLTEDMTRMLVFLYEKGRLTTKTGTSYRAGVNTIATALGMSRDSKAIVLYVEPTLIERGYVQVGHGGRVLTDNGIARAKELSTDRS